MVMHQIVHLVLMAAMPAWGVTAVATAALVSFWVVLSLVIGRLTGWAALARAYRSQWPMDGPRLRFQSLRLGSWGGYNQAITFACGMAGLHIAVLFILRPGHPPLFVPWEDVTVRAEEWKLFFLRGRCVRMYFRECPRVAVGLSPYRTRRLLKLMPEEVAGREDTLAVLE